MRDRTCFGARYGNHGLLGHAKSFAYGESGIASFADAQAHAAVPVAGDVAHDAVDSGNPVKVGGKASGPAPAVVAEVYTDLGDA